MFEHALQPIATELAGARALFRAASKPREALFEPIAEEIAGQPGKWLRAGAFSAFGEGGFGAAAGAFDYCGGAGIGA